jgi:hypothetical protein
MDSVDSSGWRAPVMGPDERAAVANGELYSSKAPASLSRGSDSTISRSGRQDLPLPYTGSPQAASSNILPNIVLGTRSTGYVEKQVNLQAEAAADDLFHDLGGAAEDRLDVAEP